MRSQVTRSEAEILLLEEKIAKAEAVLGNPDSYWEAMSASNLYKEYELMKGLLKREMDKWEELTAGWNTMTRGSGDQTTPVLSPLFRAFLNPHAVQMRTAPALRSFL